MTIDSGVFDSEVVQSLCRMYAAEYPAHSLFSRKPPVPAMLNAVGACAGFAAQVAVWRELILPNKRNPGEFLVHVGTKSHETFFFGEAINQFLLATPPDRVSFLSFAAATLSSPSEMPAIADILRHVAGTLGTTAFGQPRVPPDIALAELPRAALAKTWSKALRILQPHPAAEWPALLGAAAHRIISANRDMLAPPVALRILLEAAIPMSKLDPGIGVTNLAQWSKRALAPDGQQEIVAEVRRAMPMMPSRVAAPPLAIARPTIAFLNLHGANWDAIVAQDRAAIGAMFGDRIRNATGPVPNCDVLFLYCELDSAGEIVGRSLSVRDVIRESGARVVVIASEVRPDIVSTGGFQRALEMGNDRPVNLVIVMNRNGAAFSRFFVSLFQDMWRGVSMPMAWVKLAPQGPQRPSDIPGTVCIMAAGQVTFSN